MCSESSAQALDDDEEEEDENEMGRMIFCWHCLLRDLLMSKRQE